MRNLRVTAAIVLTFAANSFASLGHAQLLDRDDQSDIQDKYLGCVEAENCVKGAYNLPDWTPGQLQKYCYENAFLEVYVDKCVSLTVRGSS